MDKLGLEMEMVSADCHSGKSHAVWYYFEAMARRKRARGEHIRLKTIGARVVAVMSTGAESGLDNAFNHLESALEPVQGGAGALDRLAAQVHVELGDVLAALAEEGAVVLNVAQHPDCPMDDAFYRRVRAPKPIYDDWVEHRRWAHHVGVDAKAQNGPTTSIPAARAAQALNVSLALAPALVALFANSPLEGGEETGHQENRLSLWPRMFAAGRFAGDLMLSRLPGAPFADLGAYFRWAYGPGTVMQTVPAVPTRDYKAARACRVTQGPSVMAFLAGGPWAAVQCDTGKPLTVHPDSLHFEYLQFAPFLDARFRFRFGELPALPELLDAVARPRGLEALLEASGAEGYIEGRTPGASFCDAGGVAEMGWETASTATLAPSAVQMGLLANLDEATRLVDAWGWARLAGLRERAMRLALADDEVHALAGEVLAVARAGLGPLDRPWLAHAEWTWRHRRTAADRLLQTWREGGDRAARLRRVAERHAVLLPRPISASRSAA